MVFPGKEYDRCTGARVTLTRRPNKEKSELIGKWQRTAKVTDNGTVKFNGQWWQRKAEDNQEQE